MLSLVMANVVILNIAMLNVVILNIVMLNVTNDAFMPSVIMPNVVIHDVLPWHHLSFRLSFQTAGQILQTTNRIRILLLSDRIRRPEGSGRRKIRTTLTGPNIIKLFTDVIYEFSY
jgi:hypothetical protein